MKDNFQHHVDAIEKKGILRLIVIPILIALVVFAVLPTLFTQLLCLAFNTDTNQLVSIPGALGMGLTLIVGSLLMAKVSNIKITDLGWSLKGALGKAISGAFLGIAFLALVAGILNLLGAVDTTKSAQIIPSVILTGFFFFIFQGTWEELIYRSYLMPHFAKVMGAPAAIILSSALFTLGHALNPGLTFMPILNLFVASIVFSLFYYRTGNLIMVGLAHGVWNFSQGYIFGSEVSGNLVKGALLASPPVKNMDLYSGGHFGFEGGLVTTLVGLVLIVLLVVISSKKAK